MGCYVRAVAGPHDSPDSFCGGQETHVGRATRHLKQQNFQKADDLDKGKIIKNTAWNMTRSLGTMATELKAELDEDDPVAADVQALLERLSTNNASQWNLEANGHSSLADTATGKGAYMSNRRRQLFGSPLIITFPTTPAPTLSHDDRCIAEIKAGATMQYLTGLGCDFEDTFDGRCYKGICYQPHGGPIL